MLRTAAFLLEDWPERFLGLARAAHTRTSDFAPEFARTPAWFSGPLRAQLTPLIVGAPPTAGILRARRLREFILGRRHDWPVRRWPRLVAALRAAGFFSPGTDDGDVRSAIARTIARAKATKSPIARPRSARRG